MNAVLRPAAGFEYSTRVRELFADLRHAGSLVPAADVLQASAGLPEQGARIHIWVRMQADRMQTVRYQAYGCPYFLAACECLAQWLEGRPYAERGQWPWRDLEAQLAIPAGKRARLLVLEEVLNRLG